MTYLLLVYINFCNLVGCANVQQDSALVEALRQPEAAAIRKDAALRKMLVYPGKQTFRAEGDLDGKGLLLPLHHQLPNAI